LFPVNKMISLQLTALLCATSVGTFAVASRPPAHRDQLVLPPLPTLTLAGDETNRTDSQVKVASDTCNAGCIPEHVHLKDGQPLCCTQGQKASDCPRPAHYKCGAAAPPPPPPQQDFEKGIIYVQPSYHFANTLDLDINVMSTDLDKIAASGFANVGLRVSWGELMSSWDSATHTATYNDDSCTKIGAIAAELQKRKLRLIVNTHLLDTVPEGVEGARFVNQSHQVDANGVPGPVFWATVYKDAMVRDSFKEPILLFHVKFAQCLKDYPTVPRFWKHSFESAYFFPQTYTNAEVNKYAPAATAKFQQWAQDTNSSLSHWAVRWGEDNYLKNWSMVTIPHKTEHAISKAKFGDYWRFWLLGVLKDGKYGLSIGDIYQALAQGAGAAYSPGLAFKHWEPKNFQFVGDVTDAELVEAYDLPINATALGYYVNDPATLAQEPAKYTKYIQDIKAVAPKTLPIIDWETGASTFNLTNAQQAEWATLMMETSKREGLGGFNWWQFVDWSPIPTQSCGTATHCELFHFGAHYTNGTEKPCWAVLTQG